MRPIPALLLPVVLPAAMLAQSQVISGDYVEARSNHVYGCYCEWSSDSVAAGREAILGWSITDGEYDGVALAGARFAAVIVSEDSLSAGSATRKSILFLDSHASRRQQAAAEKLLRERYAGLLGKVLGVQVAPIDLVKQAEIGALRIGDLAEVGMRKAKLPEDALQGAVLWFRPFIPLKESTLGTTLDYKYWGGELDRKWDQKKPGITGYFGTFEMTGR